MPDVLPSTIILVILAGTVVLALSLGIRMAASRAAFARPWVIAAAVCVGLFLWLGVTALLALSGSLDVSPGRPPREPLLPPIALVTFVLLSLTSAGRRLVSRVPVWTPIAFQSFRIGVETAFWLLHREGLAPVQVTFEGRNFDILVGLSAPLMALAVAKDWIGPRIVIAWNLFGVAMLGNAIWTAATSSPGPQHLDWPGEPFVAIAEWPVVWIPALLAPTAMLLHYVSIRQAIGRLRVARDLVSDLTATRT